MVIYAGRSGMTETNQGGKTKHAHRRPETTVTK